jgi:hypothetical protein
MGNTDTRVMHVEARYYGPTNYRGSRIAIFRAGRKFKTVPYPYAPNDAFDGAIRAVFPGVTETERVYETDRGYIYRVTMNAADYDSFIDAEIAAILKDSALAL